MAKLTLSDKYALAATAALIIMLVVNNPITTLALSAVGIAGGFWVVRRGEVRRAAFLAVGAFVIAGVFAITSLMSSS